MSSNSEDADGIEGGVTTELGAGIRSQRERRGLSLRAVASAVGISASMLSQVETGKLHPSVATLYQIASYLDISVDALMGVDGHSGLQTEQEASRVAVVRAGEGPTLERGNGVTWQPLAGQPSWQVQSTLVTYQPSGSLSHKKKMTRHNGIESGYVLEGELTLFLGFENTILRPGDSFCFDATAPHLFVNESTDLVRGIWFIAGEPGTDGMTGPVIPGTSLQRTDPLRALRTGI